VYNSLFIQFWKTNTILFADKLYEHDSSKPALALWCDAIFWGDGRL